jgi:hypothetical protein
MTEQAIIAAIAAELKIAPAKGRLEGEFARDCEAPAWIRIGCSAESLLGSRSGEERDAARRS